MTLAIIADLVSLILIVGGVWGLTTRRTVRQATGTVTAAGLAGLLYLLLYTATAAAFPGSPPWPHPPGASLILHAALPLFATAVTGFAVLGITRRAAPRPVAARLPAAAADHPGELQDPAEATTVARPADAAASDR